MKSDFLVAITQLSAEKNLPRDKILQAVEQALATAYKKEAFAANQSISVKIHPATGEMKVYLQKTVVEESTDSSREVSLAEARKLNPQATLGEVVEIEIIPMGPGGRIAAQTAKQVVLQRLREAEREIVFEEYAGREGEMVSGVVQRLELRHIVVNLGKGETILPISEQVRTEHYRVGQRLKLHVLEVQRSNKGAQVIVSRAHRNLLRRLLELEVPEIQRGIVEIKDIAREAGSRSKVSVVARQEKVDAVGSCVGMRGLRIQNIVTELNGEKVDVVQWHPDPKVYIANALSPAQVVSVEVNSQENTAQAVVLDRQLSLAIGKEGQNVRLAAKLTGWKIDIKGASVAEAERAAQAALAPPVEAPVATAPMPALEEAVPAAPADAVSAPGEVEALEKEAPALEEEGLVFLPLAPAEKPEEIKPVIRFAEEVLGPRPAETRRGKAAKGREEGQQGPSQPRLKGRRPRAADLIEEAEEGPEE